MKTTVQDSCFKIVNLDVELLVKLHLPPFCMNVRFMWMEKCMVL